MIPILATCLPLLFQSSLDGLTPEENEEYEVFQYLTKIFPKKSEKLYLPKGIRKISSKFNKDKQWVDEILEKLVKRNYVIIKDTYIELNFLGNQNRKRIYDLVENYPGIYPNYIISKLSLSVGLVIFHLNELLEHNLIKYVENGNIRCYGVIGEDNRSISIGTLILKDTIREILQFINKSSNNAGANDISSALNINRTTVNYNLKQLHALNLLSRKKQGRSFFYDINHKFKDKLQNAFDRYSVAFA